MRERAERFYPRRAEVYRAWIDIMEAASTQDEAARIALADRMKRLANREKNARGQVAGIRRGRILEKQARGRAGGARLGGQAAGAAGGRGGARRAGAADRRAAADLGPRLPARPDEAAAPSRSISR